MKNKNIIQFYTLATKLKDTVRTGWKEVGISASRMESVAEHIYGCFILTLAIDSEYDIEIDKTKAFYMIVMKELEKVFLEQEYTPDGSLTKEKRKEESLENLKKIIKDLRKQEEFTNILKEFQNQETKEAKFVNCVSKIESDFQAKKYDLNKEFKLENALEDINKYESSIKEDILPQVKNASDGWILYNRKYYKDDELFESLSQDIQSLDTLD